MQKLSSLTPTLRALTILAVSLTILLSYNFMSAAWNNAPGNPPAGNTDAPINTGNIEQVKTATFGVQNAAPSLVLDDTDTDNNKWWLHSNAYGSGPRFHLLYDRNNSGAWDAGDGMPALYVQAGADTDGSADIVSAPGSVVSNILAAVDEVRSDRYCDSMGENCTSGSSGGGGKLGYSTSLYYVGSNDIDTNVTSEAFCAVTAQNDGGCDTGAACGIAVEGDSWVVRQRAYGDCNGTMSCTYTCIGLPTDPVYTYSWITGAWPTCYATYTCTNPPNNGRRSRSVWCQRSDGTTAPDSKCTGAKPATSESCSASRRGSDC